MKKYFFLLMAAAALLLVNCDKPEPACFLGEPAVSVNGEVASDEKIVVSLLENGNLHLTATQADGLDCHWTGPNGFESDEADAVISNANSSATGLYTLKTSRGICSSEKTVDVEVQSIVPTCTPQNNRITFTEGFFADNFYGVYTGNQTGVFQITANGNNTDMTISFATDVAPETGVYNISTDCPTSFLDAGSVCLSLVTHGYSTIAESGDIYVTRMENGKYSVSFCDVPFQTPGTAEANGSCKITQN